MGKYDLITVLGPTACGKTRLAVALADRMGGEILSADSRQVYRGMDIGTGKDLADYEIGSNNEKNHVRRPENRTSTYTCKNKRGSLSHNNVGKTNLKYRPMSL